MQYNFPQKYIIKIIDKDIVKLMCVLFSLSSRVFLYFYITEYHRSYSRRRVSMIYKQHSRCSGH